MVPVTIRTTFVYYIGFMRLILYRKCHFLQGSIGNLSDDHRKLSTNPTIIRTLLIRNCKSWICISTINHFRSLPFSPVTSCQIETEIACIVCRDDFFNEFRDQLLFLGSVVQSVYVKVTLGKVHVSCSTL